MWLSELSTYHIDRTEWLWNHTRATIYKHIGTSNRQRGKNEKNRTLASAYPFSTDLYKFQYQRHKTPENSRTKTKTTTIKYSEKYEKIYPQDMRRWVFFLLLMLNDYKRFLVLSSLFCYLHSFWKIHEQTRFFAATAEFV